MAIVGELRREVDITNPSQLSEDRETLVRARIRELVHSDPAPLTIGEKGTMLEMILDEIFGFGPIGPLLRDPSVQGIYVTDATTVYVERHGELVKTTAEFESKLRLRQAVDDLIRPQQLNHDCPMVTCTLLNGTWVLAAIRPGANDPDLLIIRHSGDVRE